MKSCLFFLLFSLFVASPFYAQIIDTQIDTTNQPQNDAQTAKKNQQLYNNIQKYSEKSKLGRFLHKNLINNKDIKKANPVLRRKNRDYQKYEGKIIRKITIETLDPFGFSVSDTTKRPKNWGEKSGNKIHIKSKNFAIRNLLLLQKNKPLDSLLVHESERLIRNQRFVSQVVITAELTSANSDSVDVYVRALDSWSLIPKGSISSSRTRMELVERNFIGTGSELRNRIVHRNTTGDRGYFSRLVLPNIKNSFIRTELQYRLELDKSYGKSLNIERRFFSPFTKWAGGVYIDEQFKTDSLFDISGNFANQNFKYNSQDFWAARSFQLFNGNDATDRTTNFILAARVLHTQFTENPLPQFDPSAFYTGENFFLASFGVSSRQFVEDKFLFNYNIIEDVPVGKVYNFTAGYQRKNNTDRIYLGGRASFGNYFKFGYLSANVAYGTFFNGTDLEQSAFTFQANYFTNLISLGSKWQMRQFIKPQVVLGWNRLGIKDDQISLDENTNFQGEYGAGFRGNNMYGIRGFNTELFGTKKAILSLQTQFYSPWDVWSFRINPYFSLTAALLENQQQSLIKSRVYSSIVLGVIISNDYLVFNSFQFSLAFYPVIPGLGTNIFNTNSFQTEDFGFQDFELGKPRTILYE